MRFFTRAWATGELTDEAFEATPGAYRDHVVSLNLPPPLAALAAAYLHDARLLGVDHEPERGQLALRLRCGDLQRGYHDLHLVYSGATLSAASLAALGADETEVLYAEVDRKGEAYEHRLLLWPSGEVAVGFESVEMVQESVASRSAV